MKRRPIPDDWPRIVVATGNAGPASTAEYLAILEDEPDLLLSTEFGDQGKTRAAIIERGYGVNDGKEAGRTSTPTFWRRATMRIRRRRWVQLLGRQFAGKGAGPSRLKAKGLNLTTTLHLASRRIVDASAYHAPASQQFPLRLSLAKHALTGIWATFGPRHIRIVGGDWNSRGKWLDRVMWLAGWTSSDRELGELATHGRQSYDRIYVRRSRNVRFVEHHTVRIGSDHLGKTCTLAVKPRRKVRPAWRTARALVARRR